MTTTSEPAPAWLVAWRERRGGPQQAAQPVTQRAQPAAPAPTPAARTAPAQAAAARRYANPAGYSYPKQWAFDGGARREPVLDLDHAPPRVVRRVGWHRCMRCRKPFWSEDVVRLRLCTGGDMGCREHDDRFASGETGGSYRG